MAGQQFNYKATRLAEIDTDGACYPLAYGSYTNSECGGQLGVEASVVWVLSPLPSH